MQGTGRLYAKYLGYHSNDMYVGIACDSDMKILFKPYEVNVTITLYNKKKEDPIDTDFNLTDYQSKSQKKSK